MSPAPGATPAPEEGEPGPGHCLGSGPGLPTLSVCLTTIVLPCRKLLLHRPQTWDHPDIQSSGGRCLRQNLRYSWKEMVSGLRINQEESRTKGECGKRVMDRMSVSVIHHISQVNRSCCTQSLLWSPCLWSSLGWGGDLDLQSRTRLTPSNCPHSQQPFIFKSTLLSVCKTVLHILA